MRPYGIDPADSDTRRALFETHRVSSSRTDGTSRSRPDSSRVHFSKRPQRTRDPDTLRAGVARPKILAGSKWLASAELLFLSHASRARDRHHATRSFLLSLFAVFPSRSMIPPSPSLAPKTGGSSSATEESEKIPSTRQVLPSRVGGLPRKRALGRCFDLHSCRYEMSPLLASN